MTYAGTATWVRERLWFGLVIGAVPWIVWIGSLAVGGWKKDAEGILIGSDHLAFYSAARCVYEGHAADMYDYNFESVRARQSALIGWEWDRAVGYRNPPFYPLLYLPTAGLSYYASWGIWTIIGLGLLVLSIHWLKPERPAQALLWALAFYPVFAIVGFGQNTFLSLAVFSGVYRLTENQRLFTAGLVAGLLWFKPQLLIGLFVWWALNPRRYIRSWVGVGVTGLVLAAVSWGVLPEASWAFVESLQANVGYGGENMWNKHTPRAFFEMLLPGMPAVAFVLGAIVSLLSIGIAWWVARRTGAPIAVLFPVAVFLSLWASPHTLIYEWGLLVAACVVLWEKFPQSRDAWLCLFTLAWLALTMSTTVSLVQIKYLQGPEWPAVQLSVPMLGVAGWLAARELMRASRAHT